MNSTASTTSSNTPSYSALAEENALLREQLQVMQRQLDWFKKRKRSFHDVLPPR
tara:strand:- start:2120 stop:2281 length:162 start_codon:yes stop_codon:yes gene_type:complete